ncbi:GNAT family N-acetyltransferase [Tumebacillus algifaecis]|uniref:GNAT family N-acetyltransferase n=1 Tax=Tumebacillus algifaecis TaxID=1214604 RepID=A0A223D3I6_9BACL|nr:N-acetyltransferase [Tumebacillus algifaecis]ASS75967.1 GNAT family N-acetyltransferase [Tumebacillus algifaecis]
MTPHVQKLQINYKTLEEFRKFRENGLEELSMLEDLKADLVEDHTDSPFYGIYEEGKLVARMSLYQINEKYDRYFEPPTTYHELMKLEVLPGYKGKGYGAQMVQHAKTQGLPIKTNVRLGAQDFFLQLGFKPVKYDPVRDRGENPYVWHPEA